MTNSPTHRHTLTYWSLIIIVPDLLEYQYNMQEQRKFKLPELIYDIF